MLKELTNKNFNKEIKTGLKLIEFYAPWCGYCQKEEEELIQMDRVWIGQINADTEKELVLHNGIKSLPTFLIFNNGKEVERFSGFYKKEHILSRILRHI